MFRLDNAYKSFDKEKTYILNNMNFSFNEGDFIAITGKSGAGKSTLVNILGTIDTLSSGKYTYNNLNLDNMNERALAEFRNRNIGIVFQDYNLIMEYSVRQNILLPKLFSKNKDNELDEIAKKLHIDSLLNRKAKYLSGGEQQRVAVARAIINNPTLVLADEPTGNLDEDNSDQLYNILKKLNSNGT
ncbi:MAG: hypothetical protein A2558_09875, partial [Tenericutes bacterium RIFOXYD2_FULL_35_11]